MAGLMRASGVGSGDRVGIVLPNTPAFVAAYYGALRLGAIAVPLNPLLRAPELRLRLEHAGARAVVAAEPVTTSDAVRLDPDAAAAADPVEDVAERDEAETAVILYTSGTTGEAKGAELSHERLRSKAAFLAGPLLRSGCRATSSSAPRRSRTFSASRA